MSRGWTAGRERGRRMTWCEMHGYCSVIKWHPTSTRFSLEPGSNDVGGKEGGGAQ